MEAYFDNSATTKVLDCVKDAVVDAMCVNYGNAAAKHRKGVEAENLIREAKKAIADTLKVQAGKAFGLRSGRNYLYFRRNRIEQYGADRHGAGKPQSRKTPYHDRCGTSVDLQYDVISGGDGL